MTMWRRWPLLLVPALIVAGAAVLLDISSRGDAPGLTGGVQPYATEDAAGTSGIPGESPGIVGTPLGELMGPDGEELTELVGRRVTLAVDVSTAINDVALWAGAPGDLLVVFGRDARASLARARGASELGSLPRTVAVTGVVEAIPYPEAMYSWGLTDFDAAALDARGAYVRVERVDTVAPAPASTDGQGTDEHPESGVAPPMQRH